MAQNFVGANNLNLLVPQGQLGTRLMGGKDHSSARYIYTMLEKYVSKIFNKLDNDLLEYLEDEKLIGIIKTHSSYIEYPIMFQKEDKTWEKINWVPIWAKPRDSITHQEYVDFYLNNIQDNLDQIVKEPPIIYKHFNVEGAINFTALLYVPEKAPFNLFEPSKRGQSLKLYTKNVLITADQFWLNFKLTCCVKKLLGQNSKKKKTEWTILCTD